MTSTIAGFEHYKLGVKALPSHPANGGQVKVNSLNSCLPGGRGCNALSADDGNPTVGKTTALDFDKGLDRRKVKARREEGEGHGRGGVDGLFEAVAAAFAFEVSFQLGKPHAVPPATRSTTCACVPKCAVFPGVFQRGKGHVVSAVLERVPNATSAAGQMNGRGVRVGVTHRLDKRGERVRPGGVALPLAGGVSVDNDAGRVHGEGEG